MKLILRDIPKDAGYFFKYISFETGIVTVEPEKAKWDIAWNYFGNVTNFGAGEVPYLFQDMVIQNRNVQVAKVLTSAKAYADFTGADISPSFNRNAVDIKIGSQLFSFLLIW